MKNFIKENWFKLIIVFLFFIIVGIYSYKEFKPKSIQDKLTDCLKLNTDIGVKTCVGLLSKQQVETKNNILQELAKTIGGEPDSLEWVYLNKKPYLYYYIIDGGTKAATVSLGLLSVDNFQHYWISYFGYYHSLINENDTILPVLSHDIKMSENLTDNAEIYNFLKQRSSIDEKGRVLLKASL